MTREECIATLLALHTLAPASAHTCAEAVLLAFLLSAGEEAVVEAYLTVVPGDTEAAHGVSPRRRDHETGGAIGGVAWEY